MLKFFYRSLAPLKTSLIWISTLFLIVSTFADGQEIDSAGSLKGRLEAHNKIAREKYNFYEDFVSLKTIRYRQGKKGYPELTKRFFTMTLKANGQAVNMNAELQAIYDELTYLIDEKPEAIKRRLHAPIYDIECSYKGEIVKLRLTEGMDSQDLEEKKWIARAQDLHLKIFRSIVLQAAPENSKKFRSLERAE